MSKSRWLLAALLSLIVLVSIFKLLSRPALPLREPMLTPARPDPVVAE